ncbi:MAG: MlaD family protein [Candidatus Omnitrophica bacterium]|nr:MlaD family protein [Candidatus Omnitrophota bacterium]
MRFGKTKLELKVGIFVFIGLVILAVFVLSIGNFRTWASGYKVSFTYNFADGMKLGAPVRFSGIDVGEVKKINLIFDIKDVKTRVQVVCWVREKINIPVDSTVWVNTLGLLGEKYIEIMPGQDYAHCMANGDTLAGVDPIPMHTIVRKALDIAGNVDESIVRINKAEGTVGKLLYDDKLYNELEALVTDIRKNPWKLFHKTKEKK